MISFWENQESFYTGLMMLLTTPWKCFSLMFSPFSTFKHRFQVISMIDSPMSTLINELSTPDGGIIVESKWNPDDALRDRRRKDESGWQQLTLSMKDVQHHKIFALLFCNKITPLHTCFLFCFLIVLLYMSIMLFFTFFQSVLGGRCIV